MKRILLIMLLCAWAAALAQTPPDGQATAEPESVQEQLPEANEIASEEDLAEMESTEAEEELTEAEKAARAMADEDFKPGDEISEDYPVPLPSDI